MYKVSEGVITEKKQSSETVGNLIVKVGLCKTWKIDDSFYSTDTGDKNKKRSIDNNIPNEN